jgi:uncharacterized protein (UPF0210 family)
MRRRVAGLKIIFSLLAALALAASLAPRFAGAWESKSGSSQQQPAKKHSKDQEKAKPADTDDSGAEEAASKEPAKPKVRTITAFLTLNRDTYEQQIADTVDFLSKAKAVFEKAGFEVQTLRIATQPFPEYTRDLPPEDAFTFLRKLDHLAGEDGFLISVGPAMQHVGDDPHLAGLLANALAPAENMNGSVVIGGEDGIHWDAVGAAAGVIAFLAEHSPRSQGNFSFAAVSMVPPGTPFFPAGFNSGNDHQFAIGLQSANVIAEALKGQKNPAAAENAVREKLGAFAVQLERIGKDAAQQTGWNYEGIDLSPAPLKHVSIGAAIEGYTGSWLGSSGTLSAAALITRAIQSIPVTRVGYSGLMLPVLEDSTIARRWSEGSLSVDGLLAYSSVCGTGLDTIPLPGRVSPEQLIKILGDVASLSVKWKKPLSARILPIAGKDAGDRTDFDNPRLVNVMLRPLP